MASSTNLTEITRPPTKPNHHRRRRRLSSPHRPPTSPTLCPISRSLAWRARAAQSRLLRLAVENAHLIRILHAVERALAQYPPSGSVIGKIDANTKTWKGDPFALL